ncbi:hypothetical protein LINGRAHAP2_LOCUS7453 [Linum grandiflorum]
MAASPHSIPENHHVDFRAPPPSPIASGRRSSFANDDVLTEYLENSLRVPDLILPDRIFPSQRILETPQVVDFGSLQKGNFSLLGCDIDCLARLGCFQLVNHGISKESVTSAMELAQKLIFNVPVEKRATVMVSSEKPYGFEEEIIIHGDEDDDKEEISNTLSEEFVWSRDGTLKLEMEPILGHSYSNFSVKMEALTSDIEAVGEKLLGVVRQKMEVESLANDRNEMVMQLGEEDKDHDNKLGRIAEFSTCYVRKHRRNVPAERWERSLRYDVIKMLIRGTDHSHALCFHICNALSEFHVYSKQGWISFSPEKDALIVTIGDQIQAMSNGEFRHVLGRPMVKSGEDDSPDNNSISMAFMYSPPPAIAKTSNQMKEQNTISIKQQAIVALIFTLVYHILAFLYNIF